VLLYTRNNYSNKEIIYVGHGAGGEIIGLAPASQYINKLVLVSSSLTCEKLWPLHRRILLKYRKFTGRIITKLTGYLPATKERGQLPGGVFLQMANWCDSPNGLFDSYPDNNYRKLNVPALVYTFTDDWLCPPAAVKELLNHFSNASITWYHIKPKEIGLSRVGHFNFFYLGMKQVLWHPLIKWMRCEKLDAGEKDFFSVKKNTQ
jgi:predicted alpha/beta hydrolase